MQPVVDIGLKDTFNDHFVPLLYDRNRYNIIYGGRGSGKSVFVAQRELKEIMEQKGKNLLVVRKVSKSNRHSTYALICQIIDEWGCQKLFKIRDSDMVITCINGNQIVFMGLDDSDKIKSITFKQGILTTIWAEEGIEITEDDFETLDMCLRGIYHVPFRLTLSFNPVSALSWIKKYFFDSRLNDCTIHHSTYLNNRWCDEKYKQKLLSLKEKNRTLYEINALGNWGVLGNLVYTNYEIWDFESVLDFSDTIFYNGLDWGFNDPLAGIKMDFYDDEIYVLDEMYRTQLTDEEGMSEAEKLWNKKRDRITADNSEPKSIKKWQVEGWKIKPAMKGKDSVMFGIKWCRNHKINIHPRCINFKNEIQGYCFREDKDGNILEEPVDFNNHLMDAKRYGFDRLMREKPLEWA